MTLDIRPSLSQLRPAMNGLVRSLESMKFQVLDHLPGFIGEPLDARMKQLILGIRSVQSDWDIEQLKGLPSADSNWLGHAAFAHAMVMYFKPRVVVDLGVHLGCSTFAMGLALQRLGRGTVYAVDTWRGDEHFGLYDDRVYLSFMEQKDRLGLGDYVTPMRMPFDQAAVQIKDRVDMLHVDGFHTYRAASNDFGLFRDKLPPGAVVLFHDVYNWKFPSMRLFWRLTSMRYRSYRFPHSSGLGIILTRGGDKTLGLRAGVSQVDRHLAIKSRMQMPEG